MPRSGQIIPSWLHPHEATYINDNTRYEDYAENNEGPVFLNVFMSSKGVDNKLKYYNNISAWVRDYGLPDYRRYGQPAYNAYVALSTGLACSQSMRIMPSDAAYANIILVAKYKKENNKLVLKFATATNAFLTDLDNLDVFADSLASVTPDAEGFLTLPIMTFWSRGRGLYGNDYRVRVAHDKAADKDNDYKNYNVELLSTENGALETLESYNVSFFIDAIDPNNNTTLFINDLIDDEENKGSARFNCSVNYDNLQTIFNAYKEVYDAATNTHVEPELVEELPPINKPVDGTIFVVNGSNNVVTYSADLDNFIPYAVGATLQNVQVTPVVVPSQPVAGQVTYLVKDNDAIFKYENDVIASTTMMGHEINEIGEITYDVGDMYHVINSATPSKNGYYVATSGTELAPINVIVCPDAVVVAGATIAKENILYHNDTTDIYNILEGGVLIDVTAYVQEVAELPSLDIARENVVYQVLDTGIMYILLPGAVSYTVYTDPADDPEPMVYTMATWDIFGYNRFTEAADEYMEYPEGLGAVDLLSIEGQDLKNGNDGSFSDVGSVIPTYEKDEQGRLVLTTKVLTSDARDEAIEQVYNQAFQGALDVTVKSKRRAPVDLILDANYPLSVKKSMVALAEQRYDAACHLDTNLINNIADLETFYTQISDLRERLISFDAHMFKTTDPITGRVIPVTSTLWLASKIPNHFNVYGNHTPLAGEEYATLSGYQRNSIRPIIDADDEEVKELLYDKMRMNYIECIAENTYIRGCQETSQNFWSDLSEENNMLVLLEIKRKIERLAATNRFKWTDPEELRLFQGSCNEIFSSYIGTKCATLELVVDANSWEKTRYIVHVYLAISFRKFQKRTIIEIDVNPNN